MDNLPLELAEKVRKHQESRKEWLGISEGLEPEQVLSLFGASNQIIYNTADKTLYAYKVPPFKMPTTPTGDTTPMWVKGPEVVNPIFYISTSDLLDMEMINPDFTNTLQAIEMITRHYLQTTVAWKIWGNP